MHFATLFRSKDKPQWPPAFFSTPPRADNDAPSSCDAPLPADPPGTPHWLMDPKTYDGHMTPALLILYWVSFVPLAFLARKTLGEHRLPALFLTNKQKANRGLRAAAFAGDIDRLRLFLRLADPRAVDGKGQTALMLAAKRSANSECLRFLLSLSDPLAADKAGRTALMHAAQEPGLPLNLQTLLPVSNPSALDQKGESALVIAARNARWASAQLLFPFSDPLAASAKGTPLLHIAAEDFDAEALAFFASRLRDGYSPAGETALMGAARAGEPQKIQLLLPVAEPNAVNRKGETALMLAAAAGSADCVRALAPASDCAARSMFGQTAFEIAIQSEAWDCADALCERAPLSLLIHARGQLTPDAFQELMPRGFAVLEAREISHAAGLAPALSGAQNESLLRSGLETEDTPGPKIARKRARLRRL